MEAERKRGFHVTSGITLSIFASLLICHVGTGWAGTISMQTQISAQVEGHDLQAQVSVTNLGDEAAHNVQTQLELSGAAPPQSGSLVDVLPPSKNYNWRFKIPVKFDAPGRYSLLLRTRYTDANHYPFSALSVSQVPFGQDAIPSVLAVLDSAALSSSGRIALRVKNLDSQAKTLQVRWFLPEELSAPQGASSLTVRSAEEIEESLKIKNFSALPGSTYPIFAVLDYEQDGRHFSTIASGQIRIQASNFLYLSATVWIFIIGAGLIALIGLNIFKRKA